MSLKAGPYPNAKEARIALGEAGYQSQLPSGRRPDRWVHLRKPASFAIQILDDGRAKIIPYPNLKRLDYRVTSDAERAGHGFRSSLDRPVRKRPRT